MSIVEQLVEDIEKLVPVRPKWKKTSEEYPSPRKYWRILAWNMIDEKAHIFHSHICKDSEDFWETSDGSSMFDNEFIRIFSHWVDISDLFDNPES